jgi:NitT/TauT family transport system permease protein
VAEALARRPASRPVRALDGGVLENHPAARRALRVALPLAVAAALVGIWTLVALTAFSGKGYLLPDPASVVAAIGENAATLLHSTWQTFIESSEGFVAGILVGCVLAIAMGISRSIGDALYPVAVVFQTVPVIAVAPILVLLFHYGRTSIIAIVVLVTFFPILSNTLAGLRATNPNHAELFALYRASAPRVLLHLKMPQALPSAFAGFRIAAGLAVVGATVGEFLIGQTGGQQGLGVVLVVSEAELKTPLLFAAAAFATALAVLFFLVVNRLAQLTLRRWVPRA